jgi:hypothetical protein
MEPDFGGSSGTYAYCAFDGRGTLLEGARLTAKAKASVFGYVTCPAVPPSATLDGLRAAERSLRSMSQSGRTPILSNEGWIYAPGEFAESNVLAETGLEAEVVAFVRPPLEWLNRAWWQWGAWTGASLERWMDGAWRNADWGRWLHQWAEVKGVAGVAALLVADDVVAQFHSHIGARAPRTSDKINTALPESVLRFFQRNREFRPGPHDSRIDFIVARHLDLRPAAAPWVITPELARKAMSRLAPGDDALKAFLPPAQARAIDADPAWRDAEHYAGRSVAPVTDPGDLAKADELIALLLQRLVDGSSGS